MLLVCFMLAIVTVLLYIAYTYDKDEISTGKQEIPSVTSGKYVFKPNTLKGFQEIAKLARDKYALYNGKYSHIAYDEFCLRVSSLDNNVTNLKYLFIYDIHDFSISFDIRDYGTVYACNNTRISARDSIKSPFFLKDSEFIMTKLYETLLYGKPYSTPEFKFEKLREKAGCHGYDGEYISCYDGEYYLFFGGLYRFSDWKLIPIEEAIIILEDCNSFNKCEDPKKTHWKHFLNLEMIAKKKRDKDMQDYVDRIIIKQQEYNDIQLSYDCMMSAPIECSESFRIFCKLVNEERLYADYEIDNYIKLKKLKQQEKIL